MRKHNFKGLHRLESTALGIRGDSAVFEEQQGQNQGEQRRSVAPAPGHIWLMGEQIYGVWIEGDLLSNPYTKSTCIVQHTANGDVVLEVIPETVCESTGQTDKNGIEIFENDVCRFCIEGEHSDYCVRWDEKNCRYVVEMIGEEVPCDDLDDFFCAFCTVIGSVWMHRKEETA